MPRPPSCPLRAVLCVLLLLCNTSLYCARTCISVAIIYMFPTNTEIEAQLLSAFYWGYFLSQTPAGLLAQRYNAKFLLLSAVAAWSVASVLAVVVGTNPNLVPLLFATRVLVGLAEAANYPCQMQLLSVWAPYEERATFWSVVAVGESLGTMIALLAGPYLQHAFGWRSIFYATGGLGLIWAVLFAAAATARPEQHPCINAAELRKIQASRPPRPPPRRVPWRRILSNGPFLATVATHVAYNWCFYFGLSWGDKFWVDKYGVHYKELGALSIAPYLLLLATVSMGGPLADGLERRCRLRATTTRKLSNSLGMGGGALGWLGLALVVGPPGVDSNRSHAYAAATCLTVAVGMGGFSASAGYWAIFIDLSPQHSQVLLAVSNTIASVPGIVGNALTAPVLDGTGHNWRLIFAIAGLVELAGALIFLWGAVATDQRFDDPIPTRLLTAPDASTRAKLLDEEEVQAAAALAPPLGVGPPPRAIVAAEPEAGP